MPEPLEEWSSVAASSGSLILDLLIAILAGLMTLLLVRALATLVRIGRARRGHLAGTWYQTSPDPRGVQRMLRVDQVHLRTFASRIWGYADRQAPAEEQPKRWRFRGRVSGALIFGYFWTTDIHSNPRSNGTFHLQMVDPFLWVGRYTTAVGAVDTGNSSTVIQELKDLPLEWSREPPRRRHPDPEDGQEPA
jgi:hypothetical protein